MRTATEQSPSLIFPTKGLVGSKTRLLRFNTDDISENYLGWMNDPIVLRYSNQRFKLHNATSSAAYLDSFKGTENLFISIKGLVEEESIGTLTVYVAIPHGTADIGIMIGDRRVWGKGYGLDAWKTVSDWLISTCLIRKVTGGTLSGNMGMKKIFERSGMHFEGMRRAQELVEGIPMDVLYYARFHDA